MASFQPTTQLPLCPFYSYGKLRQGALDWPPSTLVSLWCLDTTSVVPWIWKEGNGEEEVWWSAEWWARASETLSSPSIFFSSALHLLLFSLDFLVWGTAGDATFGWVKSIQSVHSHRSLSRQVTAALDVCSSVRVRIVRAQLYTHLFRESIEGGADGLAAAKLRRFEAPDDILEGCGHHEVLLLQPQLLPLEELQKEADTEARLACKTEEPPTVAPTPAWMCKWTEVHALPGTWGYCLSRPHGWAGLGLGGETSLYVSPTTRA